MVGSIGMAVGMAALSISFLLDSVGVVAFFSVIIYTASSMASWGPICWVLISEIFPNTIRNNVQLLLQFNGLMLYGLTFQCI